MIGTSIPCAVVGTKFRGPEALAAIQQMKKGDTVRLERELDNAYDGNAIQVHYLGAFVGYVPKVANPRIAAAMDTGISPQAVVEIAPIMKGNRIDIEPLIRVSW